MNGTEFDTRLGREVAHFNQVYTQEAKSGNLLLEENDKRRYTSPPADTIFAREYYYHLLAPLKGQRILEIACGNGVDTCIAAYNGANVCAYDISPAAIELTRR